MLVVKQSSEVDVVRGSTQKNEVNVVVRRQEARSKKPGKRTRSHAPAETSLDREELAPV